MPVVTSRVYSLQALATWMLDYATPNIFKSVTFSDGVLAATDSEDNTVLTIKAENTGVGAGHIRAYRSSESAVGYNFQRIPNPGNQMIEVIGCDNGFMFSCAIVNASGYGRFLSALFAKTNNDKVAVIFSTDNQASVATALTNVHHVAFGDHLSISTVLTFTPESAGQTVLAPFATDPQVGNVSYTPYAFYMPVSQSYSIGFGKFRLGSDTYITNGYWCIKT